MFENYLMKSQVAELPAELAQLPQKYFQLAGELAELC